MSAQYSATLTSFHTASPDKDPYTIYVITVKRGAQQWQVFRRYREWEDLRTALQQQTGSSPQMPGKMLFGRMRPEVIESRVVGLDNFLQLCMVTPLYASCPVLTDFLTREMDSPPEGLDLVDLVDTKFDAQAPGEAEDGSPYGQHQQQLKQLVEAASQAFIAVSTEAPQLDQNYIHERVRAYAAGMQASTGTAVGSTVPLRPPAAAVSDEGGAVLAIERMLAAPPLCAADATLLRKTAAAAALGLGDLAVQGNAKQPLVQ